MDLKFKVLQHEWTIENFGNLSAYEFAHAIMHRVKDIEIISLRPDFDIVILDKAGQWQYGKMYQNTPITYENLMKIALDIRSYFKLIYLAKLGT